MIRPWSIAFRPAARWLPAALAQAGALALLVMPAISRATVITIPASKDNTLYENATGAVSNGAGEYVFTGRTKDGVRHRGVIAFDIAGSIPAGSTVNSVTLQLHLSREANTTLRTTTLHRLLADWGEGTSNAGQNEGQGAPSTTNDATWIHRFYPSTFWATAGGDFNATAGASTGVTGNGFYTWSASTLVTDVQAWLDTPSGNFGWLILGDESVVETSKRFDSRENGQTANRPALIVDYTAGGGATGACCLPSGSCSIVTSSQCASLGGTYQGDGSSCTPNPCPLTVSLPALKDNTLYESATGALSNGAGTKVLASKNSSNLLRRGLLEFDLSTIPAGSTVQSATLTLYNAESSNSATLSLYRASASWGEGTSAATGTEDAGASSTTGDATWIHRFYPGTPWSAAGGDFAATASATATVVGVGSYVWNAGGLLADVQAWVNDASTNFGWVLRGKESGAGNALKRFESRQSTDTAHRPHLDISYLAPPPVPTGACCLPNGTCDTLTQTQCTAAGGTYQGGGSSCTTGLCPLVLTAYADSLPRPAVATPVSGTPGGTASYVIPIREVTQRLHRDLPLTRVWGYAGSFPGPTIEAGSGQPVTVTWMNDLRDSTGALRTTHLLPVDLCLAGPDTEGPTARVVTHLHGGHVPAAVDGHPDSTFLPGHQVTYLYPNTQPAATLWYHDHAMGITRLNVMLGLAGFYLVRDAGENALGLPSGEFEIPLAIQDRSFNADGSLQYPAAWMDHFFGDKMLVNGKVWPYLRVKQGKYRFRLLNGCNSRVLHLSLSNGASFQVIGTDQGLLPAPVTRTSLLLTPGERAVIVVDFAAYAAGTQIVLANDAPAPYPGNPGEGVIPNVMRFDVIAAAGHTAPIPGSLRPVTPLDPSGAAITRDFVLRKQSAPCTGDLWTINGLPFETITERPVLGTTEVWRFINESGISHPMHMHLVAFQILDRQPFTLQGSQIVTTGPAVPPDASEAGWKDTAPVGPSEILRVVARFDDYAGAYSYHCHILEHEDNEMMRQFQSVPPPVVSVGDVTVTEGNGGSTLASFPVTLSSPVQSEVRVVAFTEDVTATAGADYLATGPDTLVFPPMTTVQTFSVPVRGDVTDEFDETFRVRLAAPAVAVLGDSVGLGTIADDDAPPALGVDDVFVAEGNSGTHPATFTLALSARSGKPVQVLAGTADGTAMAGQDYIAVAPPALVAFAPGDSVRTLDVSVLGDVTVEPDETFTLNLSSPQNATLGDASGLGTIVNDDAVPEATVNDVAVVEGNAGTVNATFTVTLSAASAGSVRVVAITEDSTARGGVDFTPLGLDTLTFPPSTTTQTVSVPVLGDLLDEFDEVFHLRLASAQGAVITDSIGAGAILDDDPLPLLSVSDARVTEGNADTTRALFVVSLSARSGKPVQVLAGTQDGTATAGEDYVPLVPELPVVFPADDTTLAHTVPVGVLGDLVAEANETFIVRLSNAVNAGVADSSGTGSIDNDDGPTGVPNAAGRASYLGPCAPNPFRGSIALRWGLATAGRIELAVFDVNGRRVRRLAGGEQSAGDRTLTWDGRDDAGHPAGSGLYLVRLLTGNRVFRRALVLLR
jgi:FtsP/CotA-like multicopper oxidase with cupredoxin domain